MSKLLFKLCLTFLFHFVLLVFFSSCGFQVVVQVVVSKSFFSSCFSFVQVVFFQLCCSRRVFQVVCLSLNLFSKVCLSSSVGQVVVFFHIVLQAGVEDVFLQWFPSCSRPEGLPLREEGRLQGPDEPAAARVPRRGPHL